MAARIWTFAEGSMKRASEPSPPDQSPETPPGPHGREEEKLDQTVYEPKVLPEENWHVFRAQCKRRVVSGLEGY